jgi:hypothetical protein
MNARLMKNKIDRAMEVTTKIFETDDFGKFAKWLMKKDAAMINGSRIINR